MKRVTDRVQLSKLLTRPDIKNQFTCLTDLALKAETPHVREPEYKKIDQLFCDGVKVKLGPIPRDHNNEVDLYVQNCII